MVQGKLQVWKWNEYKVKRDTRREAEAKKGWMTVAMVEMERKAWDQQPFRRERQQEQKSSEVVSWPTSPASWAKPAMGLE